MGERCPNAKHKQFQTSPPIPPQDCPLHVADLSSRAHRADGARTPDIEKLKSLRNHEDPSKYDMIPC